MVKRLSRFAVLYTIGLIFRRYVIHEHRALTYIDKKLTEKAFLNAQKAIHYIKKGRHFNKTNKIERIALRLALLDRLDLALRLLDELSSVEPNNWNKNFQFYTNLGINLCHYSKEQEFVAAVAYLQEIKSKMAIQLGVERMPFRFIRDDWTCAYGHIGYISFYLKKLILENDERRLIIVTQNERVSNRELLEYYRPYADIFYDLPPESPLERMSLLLSDSIFVLKAFDQTYKKLGSVFIETDQRWKKEKRGPLLKLKPSHGRQGEELLEKLGVKRGQWFVCLHLRTDGGSFQARNSKLESYRSAIRTIAEHGGITVRIGAKLEEQAPMPHLIDYPASGYREEWADVFLQTACRFLLGTGSGPQTVGDEFGTPSAIVNWYPIAQCFNSELFFIPKLLWHRTEKRHLTFQEMLEPKYSTTTSSELLHENGVDVVDNTEDEIKEHVNEMMDRLEGRDVSSERDVALQNQFAKLMRAYHPLYKSTVGRHFLNQHQQLL